MGTKGMSTQLGTKWFTFYTKVRPWLCCLGALSIIVDFTQYTNVYLNNVWMLIYFASAIAQPILSIIVWVKSSDDYVEFVSFVKGVLLFETISIAYNQGVYQYFDNGFEIPTAVVSFIIVFAAGFFLWYHLNVKYFEKRIINEPSDYAQQTFKGVTECKSCGFKSTIPFNNCPKCGDYVYTKKEVSNTSNTALFCRKCGARLFNDSRFCHKCGADTKNITN